MDYPMGGEPIPVQPQGCGTCLQDKGTQSVNWAYVGEGKGTFQPVVQAYNYVGEGLGSYEREVVVTPSKWNPQRVYLCLCLTATLLVGIGLVIAIMASRKKPAVADQRPEQVVVVQYNCESDLDNWETQWSDAKKDWCCANRGQGCPPKSTGCQQECTFMGHTATCAFRVQWGANHRFLHMPNACSSAHQMVQGQCPACASCTLEAASCTEAPLL